MKRDSTKIWIIGMGKVGARALKLLSRRADGAGITAVDRHPFEAPGGTAIEMDGIEFCRMVRAKDLSGYVYIIILTANDSRDDIISGLKAGADDFLVKPVHEAELEARLVTVKRILDLEHSLKKKNEEIALLSITDPLTKTYNRRYLNDNLPGALKFVSRYGRPLSLMICDIDHFKEVNDTYGHQAGDRVLREFSRCLLGSVRQGLDWVARYGGEEFAIVLPETDLESAMKAAERYRSAVAALETPVRGGVVGITASFGVASCPPGSDSREITPEAFIAAADECLYAAKEGGRNRCVGALCLPAGEPFAEVVLESGDPSAAAAAGSVVLSKGAPSRVE